MAIDKIFDNGSVDGIADNLDDLNDYIEFLLKRNPIFFGFFLTNSLVEDKFLPLLCA